MDDPNGTQRADGQGESDGPDPRFLGGETAVLTNAADMAFVIAVGWDGACDMQANIDKPQMAVMLTQIAEQLAPPDDETPVEGHKVFVFERDGSAWIEMVNDDRPLVRMTLELLPDEAREIAQSLIDAAEATHGADRG